MILKLLRLASTACAFVRDRFDDAADWSDMWADILDPNYLDEVGLITVDEAWERLPTA